MCEPIPFSAFAEQKTREASTAKIGTLTTALDRSGSATTRWIGNAWTRLHYEGDFGVVVEPDTRTSVSLVFVQSRDGNTAGGDPSALGGGETDKHLLYEGLSRVAADAVLVGARTIHPGAFFSVWHPELVALRLSLGLSRHPAQVVISKRGHFDFTSLLFNVPGVPVFLIGGERCLVRHALALRERPWVRPVTWPGDELAAPIEHLRLEHGIRRISAVGGRLTATRLVDDGLVQDVYLTTTSGAGVEPGTPWYGGTHSFALTVTTRKEWMDEGSRLIFEHILIGEP
jgi:riboflavin biosynthesis pyrimidine reductase